MPKAFITGITGQDGSYLAELLLEKGYEVTGLVRPGGDDRLGRLKGVVDHERLTLIYGDLLDSRLYDHLSHFHYDEVYHLAAQSQVQHSFENPTYTFEVNATATARLLGVLQQYQPQIRMYHAGSSEMFKTQRSSGYTLTEDSALGAQSPYAAAKTAGHLLCRVYRQLGLFVVGGISFNHESRRRGENFVTRKLGLGVKEFVKTGVPVRLGNVEAMRDWHHAKDTVRGMWLSLQAEKPSEYVFASGDSMTVKDFALCVCNYFGVKYEAAIVEDVVSLKRPWDVDYLKGDARWAKKALGWEPEISLSDLVEDVCS